MLKSGEEFHGFTVLQFCGRGGFGEVYLVRDITGKQLALKTIPRDRGLENFEQEFTGLCNYRRIIENHPHLLQILHVAQDESFLYYSMEAADSLTSEQYRPFTLQNRIADGGYLSIRDTDLLAKGIREALEVLHAHGMAHRDVKPGNIVYVNGIPKLGDISLVTSRDVTVKMAGTPGFLPPDLALRFQQGTLSLEESQYCDFYALGKVIYCAFTGLPPDAFPELPSSLPLEEDQAEYARLNRLVQEYCRYSPPPPKYRWIGVLKNFFTGIRQVAEYIGLRRRFSRVAESRGVKLINRLLDYLCRVLKIFLVVSIAITAFWVVNEAEKENQEDRRSAELALAKYTTMRQQFEHFSDSVKHQAGFLAENAREMLRERERCALIVRNPALKPEQRLSFQKQLARYLAINTVWGAAGTTSELTIPEEIISAILQKVKRSPAPYPSAYAPLAEHLFGDDFRTMQKNWEAPLLIPGSLTSAEEYGLIVMGAVPCLTLSTVELPSSFELVMALNDFPSVGSELTFSFWSFDLRKGIPMANRFWELTLECRRDDVTENASFSASRLRINTHSLAEVGAGSKIWREVPCKGEAVTAGRILRISLVQGKVKVFLNDRKIGEGELGKEFADSRSWRFGFSAFGEDYPVLMLDRMDIYGVSQP